jgi:hypothetical protein
LIHFNSFDEQEDDLFQLAKSLPLLIQGMLDNEGWFDWLKK